MEGQFDVREGGNNLEDDVCAVFWERTITKNNISEFTTPYHFFINGVKSSTIFLPLLGSQDTIMELVGGELLYTTLRSFSGQLFHLCYLSLLIGCHLFVVHRFLRPSHQWT